MPKLTTLEQPKNSQKPHFSEARKQNYDFTNSICGEKRNCISDRKEATFKLVLTEPSHARLPRLALSRLSYHAYLVQSARMDLEKDKTDSFAQHRTYVYFLDWPRILLRIWILPVD